MGCGWVCPWVYYNLVGMRGQVVGWRGNLCPLDVLSSLPLCDDRVRRNRRRQFPKSKRPSPGYQPHDGPAHPIPLDFSNTWRREAQPAHIHLSQPVTGQSRVFTGQGACLSKLAQGPTKKASTCSLRLFLAIVTNRIRYPLACQFVSTSVY